MMRDHYLRSATVYRAHTLRHALIHPYLGDNSGFCTQLAAEIGDLEKRLNDLQRHGGVPDFELIQTCKEMLDARIRMYRDIN
jgi:hypothetical protein